MKNFDFSSLFSNFAASFSPDSKNPNYVAILMNSIRQPIQSQMSSFKNKNQLKYINYKAYSYLRPKFYFFADKFQDTIDGIKESLQTCDSIIEDSNILNSLQKRVSQIPADENE